MSSERDAKWVRLLRESDHRLEKALANLDVETRAKIEALTELRALKAQLAASEKKACETLWLKAELAERDSALSWDTTCLNCARTLDSSYAETCRAERAEAALAIAVEALCKLAGHNSEYVEGLACDALAQIEAAKKDGV